MKKSKYKFELRDTVKITDEAAELICSRESDVDFDFNQQGRIISCFTIGRSVMYEVKFSNTILQLPQNYLEKVEE